MNARIGGLALAVVALLAACGPQPVSGPADPSEPAAETEHAPAPGWSALPTSPLSPREWALGFWVGGRVVILGGSDSPPCPPNASCTGPVSPPLRDGAAFDPATGQWTRLADAPVPLAQPRGAVIGERIYLLVGQDGFLSYDTAADRWQTLPTPAVTSAISRSLAADGDTLLAYASSHEHDSGPLPADMRFDPAAGEWSDLPASPLGPGFDRFVAGTDHGPVLLQAPLVEQPGAGPRPSLWEAALLEHGDQWRPLPDSKIVTGYFPWAWSGGRLIAAATGVTDGGGEPPGDYGRDLPYGGMLDVAGGTWEPLPPTDAGPWQSESVAAHGEEVVFRDGLLLHVRERRWTPVPLPPGGPRWGVTAVWAADRLLLWGGSTFPEMARGELHADGWSWAAQDA